MPGKPESEWSDEEWLAHEHRHRLRDRAAQIIDDPDQTTFIPVPLNLPGRARRQREAAQGVLFR